MQGSRNGWSLCNRLMPYTKLDIERKAFGTVNPDFVKNCAAAVAIVHAVCG